MVPNDLQFRLSLQRLDSSVVMAMLKNGMAKGSLVRDKARTGLIQAFEAQLTDLESPGLSGL